ncbi:MAG: hypothetical protein CL760_01085 [Chloroflexi bacterium]|nr:hypothetical protein [Chloroflexota bacterium]|tara:strand:- start:5519 stop:6007 length:489 start_codon:yes stop_codon:yes gene_type:complete
MNMYQIAKVHDLSESHPDFKILAMHNEDERSEVATQVEDLTNKELKYGDFEIEHGYLINKENKLIIVDRESHLENLHLFKVIENELDFNSDKISFIKKKSKSDINYLLRDNPTGEIKLNGKEYEVFEQMPAAYGDCANVYIIQKDSPKQEKKLTTRTKRKIK